MLALRLAIACGTVACLVLCAEPRALANGAFPDAETVLLPPDHPEQMIVAANFGLVITEDAGATWQYTCESEATTNGRLYSLGALPDNRIFALSEHGTASSTDMGCSWELASGPFDGGLVLDYFADPLDPRRVLVVAEPPSLAGRLPAALFESQDGGAIFGPALYSAPTGGGISGVEIARTDPRVIYLTGFEVSAADGVSHPRLVRSRDAGASWQTIDLEPLLGTSRVSLAAVDPNDANRIFLRVSGRNADMRSFDAIAVSTDSGDTWVETLSLTGGTLMAFLARANGTVLVSGLLGATVVGYRSRDRGMTFDSWRSGLHPRGFGERAGTLFIAVDNAVDGYALASSDDDGDTFTPRMRFDQIQSIKGCAQAACVIDCERQASIALFPPAVCGEAPGGGGPDAASSLVSTGAGGGCACAVGRAASGGRSAIAAAILMLLCGWRRGRRRPRRSRHPSPLVAAVAATATLLAAGRTAQAYVRLRNAAGVPVRWDGACVPLEVHLGALPGVTGDEMRAAVTAAVQTWTAPAVTCTNLRIALSFADGPGPPAGNDGLDVISAGGEGWCPAASAAPADAGAACRSPSAAAATSVVTTPGGRILDADTQLNTLSFMWAALDAEGNPPEREDLQSVLTHEIGHVIGLDHACWGGIGPRAVDDRGDPVPDCYGAPPPIVGDTMFPTIDPGDISKRTLSPEARRAVCNIYPAPPGAAAPGPTLALTCPSSPSGCSVAPPSGAPPSLSAAFVVLLAAIARVWTSRSARRRRKLC